MQHGLDLVDPKLILADGSRAKRIEARCPGRSILTIAVEQPVETALTELLHDRDENSVLPEIEEDDNATILFTSGSTGEAKGALSTHGAVTTATYTHATGLIVMHELLADEARA